ncbi:MAG TPA: hypothetical protein DF774_02315 [Rheinheimera sp.]|uniref:Cro/CI family transcriptional regulator n=1 Tax=Rheinheimera sp. TaxID=1869214 RepID=UPI000EC58600|nr:Cro/CI family transcriptional regulator [Rheinheimera sp.]HCU64575.1 hypothetical protein [Rheinheimera sp.]
MRKQQVLDYFRGPVNTGRFLGISHVAVVNWPDPIPKGRAYELEKLTEGKLKVDPALYQKQVAA